MKIGIMSDTHLSAQKYSKIDRKTGMNKFFVRQFEAFEWALKYFKEHNVNTIVHCGDLYDSSRVTVYPIKRTRDLLADFDVWAIKGNHDDNNFLHDQKTSALDLTGIHAINEPYSKVLDEENNVNFVFIPWKYEAKKEMIKKDAFNILLLHHYPKEFMYEDNELYKNNWEVSQSFDLVLTGHYHHIEEFSKGKTRYLNPGSSLAAFGNEEDLEPSVWIFDTETKEYERVKIPGAVRIVAKEFVDPTDFLTDIKEENIYRLTVNTLPDKSAIMKAKRIALEVQLKLKQKDEEEHKEAIDDFWKYTKQNKPEYESAFREVLVS